MTKDTATKLKPVSEKNLAGYGLPPLAWDRALERLEEEWKLQAPPEMGGVPEPHTPLAGDGASGRQAARRAYRSRLA